jgi:N-acetylglutamate synthase-like GNAT family acetyltransferase
MPVRDLKLADIDAIDDIFNRNPSISVPSLNYMVVNAVMETEEKKIVAYGAVKLFAEAVLILDKEAPKREKAQAVCQLLQTAIIHCRDAGVETLYANSNDENFTKCLENRFKFHRVPGTLLALELDKSFEDK